MQPDTFQWVFQGILIFQIVFILMQSLIIHRSEYYNYLGYMFCLLIYFHAINHAYMGPYSLFYSRPEIAPLFDQPVILFCYVFYYRFARHFLDIPEQHKQFNKLVKNVEYFLMVYCILLFIWIAIFGPNLITEWIFRLFSPFFLTFTFYLIYQFFSIRKTKLNSFILWGAVILAIGSNISLIIGVVEYEGIRTFNFLFSVPFQISILFELIVFTSGLGYKSFIIERQKLISERALVEQLLENQKLQTEFYEIRDKISRDLHDDVGSTLGSMMVYANVAQKKYNKNEQEEGEKLLSKVNQIANDMLNNMGDLVWLLNPKKDQMEDLEQRMQDYASPLLYARGIDFTFEVAGQSDKSKVSMLHRKNIYFIFKEALHNCLKYAECSTFFVHINYLENGIEMKISDNGMGFETNQKASGQGNGLFNMEARSKEIKGEMMIKTSINKGTSLLFRFGY